MSELNGRNTKTGLYLDAISTSSTFNAIIKSTPKPNAVTRMEEMDRDDTCLLGLAGDVLEMLIDGILRIGGVEKWIGEVESAELLVRFLPNSSHYTTGDDGKNETWAGLGQGKGDADDRMISGR